MKLRSVLAITTALTIAAAGPAAADPITGAVAALSSAASWFAGTTVGAFVLRSAVSFGLSTLAGMLNPRQGQQAQRGIATETTTAGGTAPQTVIFGRYATGGHLEAPMMTHGVGDDDQEYLTYVISVSDYRVKDLSWVIVNGVKDRYTGPDSSKNGYYGSTANSSKYRNRAWLRWHDGTQTEADPTLVETYGNYERPWTEDHILTGVAYAIMTFRYDSNYKQYPEVKFEVEGAPLYDPRQDATVGGVGEQRWDDPETWVFTENPVVMVYNLLRGLTLADGSVYGLAVDADDLPLDRWVSAMNTCDEYLSGGRALEKRYTCGIEFSLDTEPLAVIEDILKSCGGQVAECGGIWNIDVGPAPFPRAHIIDEDIIVSSPRERAPFRGLADTYNCIHGSHPDRNANWVARDAPTFYRADWVQEDDGRRLVAELALPTVTQYGQVQRLMQELVIDNRLMVTHAFTLPPTALGLLPLDTLTWTSTRNGYENKIFQVVSKVIDPATLNVKVALRERNIGEYAYDYYYSGENYEDPALPTDGSPAPDDNPPEHEYTDPVTGDTLVPERPAMALGDVVALHDGAVSISTDGGSVWTRIPGTFGLSRQISAVEGQGYLVRTAGSEVAYSASLERWETIEFEAFATESIGIENGDFESGDLAGWDVVSGAPLVLDTSQPPQRGGACYLAGDGAFRIEQALPAQSGVAKYYADMLALDGSSAAVSVIHRTKLPEILSNTWSGNTITGWARAPDGELLNITLTSGSLSGIEGNGYTGARTFQVTRQSGAVYDQPVLLAFGDIDDHEYVEAAKSRIRDVFVTEGSPVYVEETSSSYRLRSPAGVDHGGNGCFIFNSGGDVVVYYDLSLSSLPFRAPSESVPTELVEEISRADASSSSWQTYSFEIDNGNFAADDLVLVVEGAGQGVYVDNIRAETVTPGDTSVRCIARDLRSRRHLAATGTGIHAIVDGKATQLCETPFAADFISANGNVLVIAAGSSVAISEDDGAIWATHDAGVTVVDIHARPQPVAVMVDGKVLSVSTTGLTETSNLGSEHHLAWDARPKRWLAVDADGAVQSSEDLVTWSQDPAMPVSVLAGDRRIVPLEIGRVLGRAESSKDLFMSDGEWTQAPSLTSRIRDMTEVR